jgi:hypothetical protein
MFEPKVEKTIIPETVYDEFAHPVMSNPEVEVVPEFVAPLYEPEVEYPVVVTLPAPS